MHSYIGGFDSYIGAFTLEHSYIGRFTFEDSYIKAVYVGNYLKSKA